MKQQEQQGLVGEKRRVVVVGGGIAGSLVAKSLQFTADVTLVDPKEYFEITWASLRPMVEPSFGEKSVINHKDYLTNGRTFASSVTNITDSHVLIAEGRLIPYDYLVIATGHKDPVPKTKTKRLDQFKAENEKITSAQSILIVGGGPTGVELAGEIAVDYPDKKVTLVHKGSRLLEFIGLKAAEKTLKWLRSKKVDVKLEQSVDLSSISDGGKIYQTSSGEPIEADCVFVCTGKPLSSAWLKGTILKDNLDEHGRLMVDGNLRVKGRENIFAIGDITGIHEIKQGYLAQEHASVAAKNIKLSMAGGKESKMATYKASSSGLAIVSLGRKEAVAQFPFTTMIGCIPGMIKSRDLFVGKTRKKMGLEA
ncbi:LOW QUALITY PROTEIN: ferroptosis suppressor protein 1-like [Tripterygium wilfordii]|uniref:LOW QUALITY PROTEIN: ferroptosis suppressor protein 1-like n=1 Tax=Tripterygium wilfordii TaxID=458696 RepID=UPI0018F84644|nr:LOW QUALITY PROTEIN: ferroptosis suppressor protein 1-like [Tripterygium wilfordii]